jgi:hypothetical protein
MYNGRSWSYLAASRESIVLQKRHWPLRSSEHFLVSQPFGRIQLTEDDRQEKPGVNRSAGRPQSESESESESELLYDWWFTANQFVLATSPLRLTTSESFSTEHLLSWSLYNILSDERMGLSITIAAGVRQRGHSQVRVPRDSWPHFTVSDSRLPQPGGSGPSICISQEQGGPIIPLGTGFPFRHLLRLSGLRCRYSTLSPHCFSPRKT